MSYGDSVATPLTIVTRLFIMEQAARVVRWWQLEVGLSEVDICCADSLGASCSNRENSVSRTR